MELLILPNGIFKKSSWSKYLSSVHKSGKTILNETIFTSVLLRFLFECSKKEKNIPFSYLFRKIFSVFLDAHTIL